MKYYVANETQTFQTEPTGEDRQVSTVTVPHDRIVQSNERNGRRKKKAFRSCLVVGFDTEYQVQDGITKQQAVDQQARNEILSYQFSVSLFSETPPENPIEVDGIIVPDRGERLSLAQYLTMALGTLCERFPDQKLPTDIYLVSHFTKADMPAFLGFSANARQFLTNVRNTFVSIDNSTPFQIDHQGGHSSEFRVRLRDTILLAPQGCKKLNEIGAILGLEKFNLDDDPKRERQIKENMLTFRAERWEQFRDYAIRDAVICRRYAERLIAESNKLFGEFKLPLTLTGFGTKLVQKDWKEKGWNPDDILGQEEVDTRKFVKKLGHFIKKKEHPFIEPVHFDEPFVTESYHGGRNEQFIFGVADEGSWRDHDLSSAYTTAMSLIGMPNWEAIERDFDPSSTEPNQLAYFSVDFEFPEHIRFPTLPVRTNNGIIFPKKGHSICAAPEYFLADQLGARLKITRSIRVPTDPEQPVFKDFIAACIEQRARHPKGSFENLFWKEVGNSTYGKTAQGLREKRVYDLHDDAMVPLPASQITQPFFASFITSFTRAVLGEVLNGFTTDTDVFSVTTDGFLSNASDDEVKMATMGPIFQKFASGSLALNPKSQPLEIKHEVHRPIGWRTRGSATLMPGEGSNSIILQKGGLKTNDDFDIGEENHFTIDQFLNRTPDSIIEYRTGITIKDMVRADIDLIYTKVEKRVSMEFDWKRKPVNQREVEFTFNGKRYKHLTFDTEPMPDHATFTTYRDAWERFNKKPPRNLKSLRDFSDFETLRVSGSYPDQKMRTYLKKENGDLDRLARDLALAFVHHAAGFDQARSRGGRMTYQDFCTILERCGIPCTINKLDYAKRKEFTPNQTPPTARVLTAIERLKKDYFEQIEIEMILAEHNPDSVSQSDFARAA